MHGIETTRTGIPSFASTFRAAIASATSEPVAMMHGAQRRRRRFRKHVAAARDRRELRRRALLEGTFWRVKSRLVGPSLRSIACDPRDRDSERIARAPHVHVRDQPQRCSVLDRLVGRDRLRPGRSNHA